MATPYNPTLPIPNGPFAYPETWYVQGPYGSLITGSGLEVDPVLGVLYATGGGGGGGAVNQLIAGPGIALSPLVGTGNVTICNTGAIGILAGPGISVSSSGGNYTIASSATGTVTSISAGTGLTGGVITNAGTIALNTSCVIPPSRFTAKGQLLASTAASTYTALSIGATPNNYVLTTDSSQPTGMRWSVPTGGTVTAVSGVAPVVVANGTTTPSISVQTATTAIQGITQLVDNTTTSDPTKALTAAQGYSLQQQINALLTGGGLTLAGTFDAALGTVFTVTTNGAAAGYVVGANLPAPSPLNADTFVIVTVGGTYDPPGAGGPYTMTQGDWLLSDGSTWSYLNTGYDAPSASTTVPGQVRLATVAETQAGTVNNIAITPYGACATYVPLSLYPAKGSLAAGGAFASAPVSLAVGTNGQILTACAACTSGLTWVTPASGTTLATPTIAGTVFGKVDEVNENYSIGCNSLLSLSSGTCNVALGSAAGKTVSSGSCNSLVGSNSGCSITSGCGNSAFGNSALCNLSTGSNNTAIGVLAGCTFTDEQGNTILGRFAGTAGCSNHVWIANGNGEVRVLVNNCGALSVSGSGFGAAGQVLQSQGTGLPPIWGSATTAAATPTALGTLVGVTSLASACSGVALGLNAGGTTAAGACARAGNVSIGISAGCAQGGSAAGVAANVMIGECAGYQNTGTYNALLGYKAGSCLVGTESNNLIVGSNGAAFAGCSGMFLLASPAVEVPGTNSGAPFIYGNACGAIAFRTAAATNTLDGCYGTSGQFLQSRGAADSPTWATLPSATKTALGVVYGCTQTAFPCNTFLGWNTPRISSGAAFGIGNTFLGTCVAAGFYCGNSTNNVAVGFCSFPWSCTTDGNIAIGTCALGIDNLILGDPLLRLTGCCNIVIGTCGGRDLGGSASRNVIIGAGIPAPVATGSNQLAIGFNQGTPTANQYWLTGCSNGDIRPGRGIRDCNGNAGTASQALFGTAGGHLIWGTLKQNNATPLDSGFVFGFTPGNSLNLNTSLGYGALTTCFTDFSVVNNNTAIGFDAASTLGGSNVLSVDNVAVGYVALAPIDCASTVGGTGNTALGSYSGLVISNTIVQCNTSVGACSGAGRGSSCCNTMVGALAGCSAGATGNNNTLLGYNAQASTTSSSNEIVLGNVNNTVIRANVNTITALSDGRDKNNIETLPIGLEFIKSLNPVAFKWNQRDPEVTSNRGSYDMGFIAQELLEVENNHRARYFSKLVFDANPEQLEAAYGRLIPVLVKAVQELSNEVDRLKEKLGE